jgi:hypothetical protein
VASVHEEARVYATLNAYRNDDFKAYVFCSDDFGKSWKQLGKSLPSEPVNVIREDPKDESILYVGTDNGLYVSFDRGETFIPWEASLPRVAIHDIAIQARENDIVLGTHGRSIYISKLDLIQEYPKIKNKDLVLMPIKEQHYKDDLGSKSSAYAEPRSMKVSINYYTKDSGIYTIRILNKKAVVLQSFTDSASYGFNTTTYDLTVKEDKAKQFTPPLKKADDEKYYLVPGTYKVQIETPKGIIESIDLIVKEKKK